jgi:hypothetical protein
VTRDEWETDVSEQPEEPTGHEAVDAVLASLGELDDVPVDEQVPHYEAAHEALRAALADAGSERDPG